MRGPSASRLEAGVDEVGRGCLAGPVVAAAVCLDPKIKLPIGLNDSKKLTADHRMVLRDWIIEHATAYAIGSASPAEIDDMNILQASYLAMHRAIDGLAKVPACLLVDGHRFAAYGDIHHECVVGGDGKVASIAAASILAKVHRDELMATLAEAHPQYAWASNKGYPTKAHKEAILLHGATPWHRRTFKGVRMSEEQDA